MFSHFRPRGARYSWLSTQSKQQKYPGPALFFLHMKYTLKLQGTSDENPCRNKHGALTISCACCSATGLDSCSATISTDPETLTSTTNRTS